MKTKTAIILATALLTPLLSAQGKPPLNAPSATELAEEARTTGVNPEGPNKGRIITSTDPNVEFFVTPDRRVLLTFLDSENKPVPLEAPVASATSGGTKMIFVPSGEGGALMSDVPLPDGEKPQITLLIKTATDTGNITETFSVDLSICPDCDKPKYACAPKPGE